MKAALSVVKPVRGIVRSVVMDVTASRIASVKEACRVSRDILGRLSRTAVVEANNTWGAQHGQ